MPSRLRAVPAWAWLAALVVVSILFRAWLGRQMAAPFIFVDELIYSELARSFAAGGEFLVRGEPSGGYGVLYPALVSPAYVLFDSLPAAYSAVKAINAVLMSLAAVPAYFLARRMLAPGLSLLAALLVVAVPSMVYTSTVMTENAFYPLFITVALALTATLERPTAARQLGLIALCLVAFLTRVQAVALAPALVTAPFLLGLFAGRPLRATLAAYRVLLGTVVGGGAFVALLQPARGHSLAELLGAYSIVGETSYSLENVARFFLYHVEELDLYVGVVPLAALAVLTAGARRAPRAVQAYLAAALSLSFFLVLAVAVFASRFADRIQERNTFPVAALLLIALLVWVGRDAPRPARATAVALSAAAVLPALLPFRRFIDTSAISDTLMLLPWWSLQDGTISLGHVWIAVLALGVALAALFAFVPRRFALVVPLAVLCYFAVTLKPIQAGAHGIRQAGEGALFTGITAKHADWIDRAVPDGAAVAVLWTARTDRFTVNVNEFFNRSVGPVYYLTTPTPGGLPETKVAIGERDGVVRLEDGPALRPQYLLVDGSVAPDGEPVARDERKGMTLYRLDGPLVSTTTVEGLYPNDTWSGPSVRYTRLRCEGGTLTVSVASDPGLFPAGGRPQRLVALVGGREVLRATIYSDLPRQVRVPLEPRSGRCVVELRVWPTAVPAKVTNGANPDPRELGLHFNAFHFSPGGKK